MNKAIFMKKLSTSSCKAEIEEFMEDVWELRPYLAEVTDDSVSFCIHTNEYGEEYTDLYIKYCPNGESEAYASTDHNPSLFIGKWGNRHHLNQILAACKITKDVCPICGKNIPFEKQSKVLGMLDIMRIENMKVLRCCPECAAKNSDTIGYKSGW